MKIKRHSLDCLFLTALILPAAVLCQDNVLPLGSYQCLLRCTANCLENFPNFKLQTCRNRCLSQADGNSCSNNACWRTCNNSLPPVISTELEAPKNLVVDHSKLNPSVAELGWDTVTKAELYVVEYKDRTSGQWQSTEVRILCKFLCQLHASFFGFKAVVANLDAESQFLQKTKENACAAYSYRVAAVNSKGVSAFSNIATLSKPVPNVSSGTTLEIISLEYVNSPWLYPNGQLADNDMVRLDLQYTPPTGWDLADLEADLFVIPYRCAFSRSAILPTPEHTLDRTSPVIHVNIPGTYMRNNCYFAIKLSSLKSKKCQTESESDISHITIRINCNTVSGAPCKLPLNRNPMCAFTNFTYRVLQRNPRNPENADVQISWSPLHLRKTLPVLYFSVRWGQARSFQLTGKSEVDNLFSHLVIMERVAGIRRTCDPDNSQLCDNTDHSLVLRNIQTKKLYGVQICAVYSRDKEFPDRELKLIQTNKIFIV